MPGARGAGWEREIGRSAGSRRGARSDVTKGEEMIAVIGGVQAVVRIDMAMPKMPDPKTPDQSGVSPWEREAYGEGGRFGSMQAMAAADPSQDRISVHYSGCGYHVAELLSRKGWPVSFISAVGEDPLGQAAIADLANCGIDTSGVVSLDAFRCEANRESLHENGPDAAGTVANGLIRQSLTSVRVEARNFLGDIEFLREDDRMLDEITASLIEPFRETLQEAELVFADGGVPAETLRWISGVCREAGVPFYLDPASVSGGREAAQVLDGLDGIMPGRREAEAMSQQQILSEDELMNAGALFTEQGIRRIVITLKGGGLYYKEGISEGILRPERVLRFSETVGAGDVVTAELLHGYCRGLSIEEAAQAAMDAAAAYLADCVDERRY